VTKVTPAADMTPFSVSPSGAATLVLLGLLLTFDSGRCFFSYCDFVIASEMLILICAKRRVSIHIPRVRGPRLRNVRPVRLRLIKFCAEHFLLCSPMGYFHSDCCVSALQIIEFSDGGVCHLLLLGTAM